MGCGWWYGLPGCTDLMPVTSRAWQAHLSTLWRLLEWKSLAFTRAWCPICQRNRVHIKLSNDETAVRCLHCKAGAPSRSIIQVLRQLCPDLRDLQVYEMSARGPLCWFLAHSGCTLTVSEYFAGASAGSVHNGTPHQDVQQLTYADASFDLCTSTDVLEHVPDDSRAFRELWRILKPGGLLVFTVPLSAAAETVERVWLDAEGRLQHRLPPEYHGDPVSSEGHILAWRNYGNDICQRLLQAGFSVATLELPQGHFAWAYRRQVVVARK